jgi:hypothetical protein
MATLQAYENGLTLGWPGGRAPCRFDRSCCIKPACECRDGSRRLCCHHAPAKRGEINGWSAGAVRQHTRWLRSVDTTQLDGLGVAVTLTVRDCPESAAVWARLRNALQERLRRAGLLRWHWVTEWQRRGVPHLHLAVYAPSEWVAPGWSGSPITDIMSSGGVRGALLGGQAAPLPRGFARSPRRHRGGLLRSTWLGRRAGRRWLRVGLR